MDGRRQTRSWLTAAIAAAAWLVLAVAVLTFAAPQIAAGLKVDAERALASARIAGVTVEVDGRTATLGGYAETDREKADAIDAVAAVPGIAGVIDAIQSGGAADAPGAYRFGAVWDGKTLALSGFMPTRNARDETVRNARDALGGPELIDGLQVAPGAPDANWPAIAAAGIAAMKTLVSANLTIVGTKVTFKGVARLASDRASAVDIVSRLPMPYEAAIEVVYEDELTGSAVAAPVADAFKFGAAYDGESIALTGTTPSRAVLAEIRKALAEALPGVKIDDRTKSSPGAPDGAWSDAVTLALREFAGMRAATLAMDGRTLTFTALAASERARRDIFAAFINLPAAYIATVDVSVVNAAREARTFGSEEAPATNCQRAFSAALAETPIVFASSSSEVPDTAEELVAKMAGIAGTCPNARLEIAGHTDASGNAAGNIRLSFQRAEAVEAALAKQGVDGRRMTAKGYGADRPVAANDNDAGKARNRRIEVIVRP